jgi:hypothetical protein
MGARNYSPSTQEVVGDIIMGLHVETTGGVLVAANFATGGVDTNLFNIYGRIAVKQLFIELTAAADANATQVAFFVTYTTPVIAQNLIAGKCASIANLGAYGRIVFVAGAVLTAAVITDSAGCSDVETAGKIHILGGVSAANVNTVGVIGMQSSDASQAATIAATAHLFYAPMSVGAYAAAAV